MDVGFLLVIVGAQDPGIRKNAAPLLEVYACSNAGGAIFRIPITRPQTPFPLHRRISRPVELRRPYIG